MQLLRVEMKGFKSFADKTTIHFSPGMTAIVGPNGSGKSNITDAMRWVLGESNVRNLRGQKAEDIIFSGTEKRKPQSAAEVTLIFDNSDGKLENELAEVAIGRRIYRNGDSEFFINRRACRLKDIHHLLADTGLGRDSMAIIGQNRVDAVLNSKPEERRLIFEDVAGISKFKLNKEEALRRIHSTEQNMARLGDVIFTLGEQLGPLEEKAEQTRQYMELGREKRLYDGALTFHRFKTAERLLTRLENEHIALMGESTQWEKELLDLETAQQELHLALASGQEALQQLEQAYAENQRLLERSYGQVNIIEEQRKNKAKEIADLEERLKDLEKSREADEQSVIFLEQLRQEDLKQIRLKAEDLNEADLLYKKAVALAEEKQEEVGSLQNSQQEQRRQHMSLVSSLEGVKKEIQVFQERKDEKTHLLGELALEISDSEEIYKEAKAHAEYLAESTKAQEEELKELVAKGYALAKDKEACRKEKQSKEDEKRQLQGRLELLQTWEENFDGYGESTKAVLQAKEGWSHEVLGAIGNLFTTEDKFLVAMEIALGAALRHVVVRTTGGASAAIQYLKTKQLGRATFLPLQTVKGRVLEGPELKEEGVLGRASDCITFDRAYEEVFHYLLGRTLVVDTLAHGLALQKKYQQKLRIVTLEGEQLQPGGALVGGSIKRQQASVLARRKEQKDIEKRVALLTESLLELKENAEGLEGLHQEVSSRQERLRDNLRQEQMKVLAAESKMQTSKERLDRKVQLREDTKEQLSHWEEEQKTLSLRLSQAEANLASMVDFDAMEEALHKLFNELELLRRDQQDSYEQLTTCRVAHDNLLREEALKVKQIEEKKETILGYGQRKEPLTKALQEAKQSEIELLPEALGKAQEEVKRLEALHTSLEEEKSKAYEAHHKRQHSLKEGTEEQGRLQQRFQVVQKKLLDMEGRLAKNRLDVENSEGALSELGFTKEEAQALALEGNVRDWQERQSTLASEMEALGPINPNALEEYEQALEKHEFLKTQEADLVTAKAQLEAVIEELNQAMATRFIDMFGVVSEHFQKIFSRLFGGGTAQLVMTDEKNILTGGVELFIQPPGKKRQPLSLLSGGERALTVIALLFAFLAYRPAPFCVLDEVDAALDEANVERFGRYLQEISDETQFIVVSHRKRTMEAAQVLQGVTMVERGVSRLLTVSFHEVEADL